MGLAFENNESYFAKEEVTHIKYPHPCLVLAAMRHPFSEDSVGHTCDGGSPGRTRRVQRTPGANHLCVEERRNLALGEKTRQ